MPLRNWRGEELVFDYSWGNTSKKLFAPGTVFAKGFVAYETREDVRRRPFRFASTDPARVESIVHAAEAMKMTSLDITSSDFDANVAKVLAKTGMKVVVTHVATRTAKQCEWRSWGCTPANRKEREKWEINRVMKLAHKYGAHVSYKADFPGTALQMKQEFGRKKKRIIKTKRDVDQFVKFMAFALIRTILKQLGFPKQMMKLWSAMIACDSDQARMQWDRDIYRDPKAVEERFKRYLKDIAKVSMNKQHKEARAIMKRSGKEMRKLVERVRKSLDPKTLNAITELVKPLSWRCTESKRREIVQGVAKLLDRKHFKAVGQFQNFCKFAWAMTRFLL